MNGYVHSVESFGTVDGPGLRFIVFVQGCGLRCAYCHNPDSWKMKEGKVTEVSEIVSELVKYKEFFDASGGGITVSGGEPLLQIDFLIDLFKKAKEMGINTTLDSCGKPFTFEEPFFSKFEELMQYTDLVLFDIKQIDNQKHKELTGQSNDNILEMAKYLSDINKPVWIRHVLVPFRSDYDEFLIRLDKFIKTLNNVDKVEILPYHTMGKYKWEEMGLKYPLEGIEPPTDDRVENAKKLLHTEDYKGYLKTKV